MIILSIFEYTIFEIEFLVLLEMSLSLKKRLLRTVEISF